MSKTEDEITSSDDTLAGNITIGAREADGNRFLIKAINAIQKENPLVYFRIISGDKAMITESIDRGLIDFGIVFGTIETAKYDSIPLHHKGS